MSRIVLVTGASKGIGKEISRELAGRGDFPLMVARNAETLREMKEEWGTGESFPCDVTNGEAVQELVTEVIRRFGRVDVLVNNAGYGKFGGALDTPVEEYGSMMETNYLGTVRMTLALLPHFLQQGKGRVINIASVAGLSGSPNLAPYVGSKFALVGFSESLHLEYAPVVQVGVLCPGPVRTSFFQGKEPSRLFPALLARELLDAKAVAREAIRLMERPRLKVIPGSLSWAMRFRRWFPDLYLRLTRHLYREWEKEKAGSR
ncbi:hypothetical protein C8P63_10348 [Melghirimyces profundicolus]|uniref:Ketoreductase domain-containing protein n=1 Tax=Melghirimyces profundicolus TaxID=1242148 RepID=A0A2T6C7L9_9BACL|nr:SDR family NAD(P)-dependent oxidoreductase [Melghirimyces profundicolus]PTX64266.1 hypothetical protein C8P63_10348 [Melghirimyces profundicolus]